jgi:hypothetical protein
MLSELKKRRFFYLQLHPLIGKVKNEDLLKKVPGVPGVLS